MGIDLKPVIMDILNRNTNNQYGYIPLMMGCSIGQLGALPAESFAERINSCGKVLLDDKKTSMKDDKLDKLITLRMNRKFMMFMREQKNKNINSDIVVHDVFNGTV